jgi:hypothetical protein
MMTIATKLEAAKAGIAAINHHDLAELRSALWGLDQRDAALAIDGARNHVALALHDLQRAVILHQEANSADRG